VTNSPEVAFSNCPVCDANNTKIYLDSPEHEMQPSMIGSSRQRLGPGRILRCQKCGFGFRQLRSSPRQLAELYQKMDPSVYESELTGRKKTASRHLEIVSQFVFGRRLLDVGCASGLFLSLAQTAGWEVSGVEPNQKLCAAAEKLVGAKGAVQCSDLEGAELTAGFDVLTLWDVLEHVPKPQVFLSACRRLLRADGFLFLNVPDLNSKEARLLGRRWPLLLPEHLNYFTRESLAICAEQSGFRVLRFTSRKASFSLKYVACRVAQHNLPGSGLLLMAGRSPLGQILIPVSLGETLAILRAT
jgi:SAM-dependent methyltransferase